MVIELVLDPQCKPLEGFSVRYRGLQSDFFFRDSFCLLLEKGWEGTKVKAVTMAWNTHAVQQETVGSWIRW